MNVVYSNEVWLEKPLPIRKLLKSLRYRLIGKLTAGYDGNYVIQKERETRPIFHLLHISWGSPARVEKYKLFRIDIFEYGKRRN